VIKKIGWIISAGKEAHIFSGEGEHGEIAIKIHSVQMVRFRKHRVYMRGDYRFDTAPLSGRKMYAVWARKEYRNLLKAYRAGVSVPKPIAIRENVVVMEFIGEDGLPAPLLKDAEVKNPEELASRILNDVEKLYRESRLVHSDLSEYNIMYWRERHYIIDWSHAVAIDHPKAIEFLYHDVKAVTAFFNREYKVETPDAKEVVKRIVRGG